MSGVKHAKPQRFDLIPPAALNELATHFRLGPEGKYPMREGDDGIVRDQWRYGYPYSLNYSALLRHLTAWWGGEDIDPENGTSHLMAVAWHALALWTFHHDSPGFPAVFDDRPGPAPAPPPTTHPVPQGDGLDPPGYTEPMEFDA